MRTTILGAAILSFQIAAQSQISYPTVGTHAGGNGAGLVDGNIAIAEFDGPYGVCYDDLQQAIYVADAFNHCIRKITNGLVITVAGNGTAGDIDGVGSNARFNTPTGVFYKNGYLYIADDLNSKIKRMDAAGNVTTFAGSGIQGFLDGPALTAKFKQPKSLVVNDSGDVFVADYENHRIRKISGGTVTTIAGNGTAGDGLGAALVASLYRPRDLCLDSAGNIYFVDLMNNKVKMLSTSGIISLIAGSGAQGTADGFGPFATFNHPVGIDWEPNSGDLIVVDPIDPKIRRVTTDGWVSTIAGNGMSGYVDGPSGIAQFGLPQDLCFDITGNMFIGDRDNDAIRVLAAEGVITTSVPSSTDLALPLPALPTPTLGQVSIDVSSITAPLTGFSIHDERGSLVLRMEQQELSSLGKGSISIDATAWPSGVYAVLISTRERLYRSTIVR